MFGKLQQFIGHGIKAARLRRQVERKTPSAATALLLRNFRRLIAASQHGRLRQSNQALEPR
jgi:hypothetical protein